MLEIELGCCLHTVCGVAEVGFVQVHLKDLVLGKAFLQLERPPELDKLSFYSFEGPVRIVCASHLLSYGASARHISLEGNVHGCPDSSLEAEAPVLEEVLVLSGDDGVDKLLWKLVYWDYVTLLLGEELGYNVAVDVQKGGWERGLEFLDHVCLCHVAVHGVEYTEAAAYDDAAYGDAHYKEDNEEFASPRKSHIKIIYKI